MSEYLESNRTWWDKAAVAHVTGYNAEDLARDPQAISTAVQIDSELMAPHLPESGVAGLSLLHLQCHIGTDTLSWARLGAQATGLDFSAQSLEEAAKLARLANLDINYVQASVEDASQALAGQQFDIVYTSEGALMWLADLDVWAHEIRTLLKPGGLFFVRDGHPAMLALEADREDKQLVVRYPYFGNGAPADYPDDDETDYADPNLVISGKTYEFAHSLEEVIAPLLAEGLKLEAFHEHRALSWRFTDHMMPTGNGQWQLPEDQRDLVPLMFSVAARG
jgi:SAM-dependent methyltransferase